MENIFFVMRVTLEERKVIKQVAHRMGLTQTEAVKKLVNDALISFQTKNQGAEVSPQQKGKT